MLILWTFVINVATFRLWELGCRMEDNYSLTRQQNHFWTLSRRESEDWTIPSQISLFILLISGICDKTAFLLLTHNNIIERVVEIMTCKIWNKQVSFKISHLNKYWFYFDSISTSVQWPNMFVGPQRCWTAPTK